MSFEEHLVLKRAAYNNKKITDYIKPKMVSVDYSLVTNQDQ